MKRRAFLHLASGAAALAASRASPALMVGDPPDAPQKRIDPNIPASLWTGVASLEVHGSVYGATLVHPRWAITAGHVAPADPATATLNFNIRDTGPTTRRIRRTVFHPRYQGFNPQSPVYDLALLELAEAAPLEARVYPLYTGPALAGLDIVLVGYGASGHGSVGVTVPASATVRRVGATSIERLIRDPGKPNSALVYVIHFEKNASGSQRPRYPTGLATGDSGSACFVKVAAAPYLLGVNTFTSRRPESTGPAYGFGTASGGQVLSAALDWIRTVLLS